MRLALFIVLCVVPIVGFTVPEWVEMGSGFFINHQGLLVTAAHVVNQSLTQEVEFKGQLYIAKVVIIDKEDDIALLKIDAQTPAFALAQTHDREQIRVMGYPIPPQLGYTLKIWKGYVITFPRTDWNKDDVWSDDGIHAIGCQGDSGGAVVDNNNAVIGVFTTGFNMNGQCSKHGGYREVQIVDKLVIESRYSLTTSPDYIGLNELDFDTKVINDDAVVMIFNIVSPQVQKVIDTLKDNL